MSRSARSLNARRKVRRPLKALGLLLLALMALWVAWSGPRYYRAARLLLALREAPHASNGKERTVGVDGPGGKTLVAKIYDPPPSHSEFTIIVAHGIHHEGIREPRLVHFARELSRQGYRVVTPELHTLTEYAIDQATVETLSHWIRSEGTVARPVGLIGFSFAGSMALLAATDTEKAARLRYVASIGGYHDLYRTLRYLATGEVETTSGKQQRKAHEYGILLLVLDQIPSLGLGVDATAFRNALLAWLREDRRTARELASSLRTARGKRLFSLIERKRLVELRPQILGLLEEQRERLARLSPRGRLASIDSPIVLIHGSDDSVIPPEETLFAAHELSTSHGDEHSYVITDLLTHAELDTSPTLSNTWELVVAVAKLL